MIWPDADPAGEKYRDSVGATLLKLGTRNIFQVDARALGRRTPHGQPRECPDGWDIADAVDEGWSAAELRAAVDRFTSPWKLAASVEWPLNYKMSPTGLLRAPGKDEDEWQEITTAPFSVVGEGRNQAGNARGLLLAWQDDDGREQRGFVRRGEGSHPVRDLLGYYWEESGERIWAFTTSGLEEVLLGIGDFTDLVRRLSDKAVIRRGDTRIQSGKKIRGKKMWLYVVPHSAIHADL